MTILVVDDDVDDLDFFTEAVNEINKDVKCVRAENGVDALNFLDAGETHPDYIFLDLNMPKMDGKQCLRLLKKSPVHQHIPVIIYSTSRRKEDIEDVTRLGAAAFLVKPTTFSQLKQEISAVINRQL